MAAGTRHFMLDRPDDWNGMGIADGLTAEEEGLFLRGSGKGVYTSMALDTLAVETVWHRLRLRSHISGNGRLKLYIYCSDSPYAPPPYGGGEDGGLTLDRWLRGTTPQRREAFFTRMAQASWDDCFDQTLYGLKGRYLWFCLVLSCFDGREISVESLKLEFPRVAFIDYLPQVYRGADSVNSFLARFLSVFQSVYVDLEEDIDRMPARCDPASAPPEFLSWLAECLALPDRFLWPEDRLRVLLQNAVRLYRLKGTGEGLCQVLELYTGRRPVIIEQFLPASTDSWRGDEGTLRRLFGENRYTFTVLMPRTSGDTEDHAKIWRVIEAFKPVETVCNLVFTEDTLVLGRHCYLGINTALGRNTELVLDGEPDTSAPYLT